MLKLIKWLLMGILGLAALSVAVVAYLIFGIDPNTYKPELEALAAENNIELKIQGELSWKVFPALAVSVGETSLKGADIPATHFNQADFTLDWKALFNKKISFSAIAIEGADIHVTSSQEGANLASLPGVAASSDQVTEQTDDLSFGLAISELTLSNSRITVDTGEGQPYLFEQVSFNSKNLNTLEQPFPLSMAFTTQLPDDGQTAAGTEAGKAIQIDFRTELSINLAAQQFRLIDAKLSASEPSITLNFDALYDAINGSLTVDPLSGKLPTGELSGKFSATGLSDKPAVKGSLTGKNINLKDWINNPPNSTDIIGFNVNFLADNKTISLPHYRFSLGDFSGEGALSLSLDSPRQLNLSLKGNDLQLASTNGEEASTDSAALLTPLLAPLLLLDGGKGHIEAQLDSFTNGDITIHSPKLDLRANGRLLELTNLSGEVFGGDFQLTSRIDLRNDVPAISFNKQLHGINLQQALPDDNDLSGILDFTFTGKTRGDNASQLQNQLSGDGSFTVTEPRINNINVERSYCEMAALVEGNAATEQVWPPYTELDVLKGTLNIRQQKLNLPGLSTRMGNIAINGNGVVNLEQQTYNMLINANLQGSSTSENGCNVKSTSIRNRDIPFRCTGSFADDAEGSCVPDKSLISRLIQEKLLKKLFKLPGDNNTETQTPSEPNDEPQLQEAPADSEEQPDLEDQLKKKAIDSLLRGIFNQ